MDPFSSFKKFRKLCFKVFQNAICLPLGQKWNGETHFLKCFCILLNNIATWKKKKKKSFNCWQGKYSVEGLKAVQISSELKNLHCKTLALPREFLCATRHPFLSPVSCSLHRWKQCVHRVNFMKSSPCRRHNVQSALSWCCPNTGFTKWHVRAFCWIPLTLKGC